LIVATAGHVDHGKTSLVRQLTGVDTDRLEEEKRRGLSINLGFAYRQLEDGTSVGFIDVPGHSRFINTMIAGVGAIDLAMLVVAVDDGPMPQTYEHLDVLRLLGVEHFILLLTKVDRVDFERVDEVEDNCLSLLPDGTDVFRVSNISGEGIPQVQEFLDARGRDWRRQNIKGRFRLSTDRAFHLKGAGLVVTGTAISGRVKTGASLVLQPGERAVRVRGIHAQDEEAEWGSAGQRCALNISGSVTRQDIERGDWLVEEGSGPCTGRFDARFTLLPASPLSLRHLVPVKLYIGAKRLPAKLVLLRPPGKEGGLDPGDTSRVQLIVDG
jgi:selenocysteine-specific elongation factor